jgi:hypothetical protein
VLGDQLVNGDFSQGNTGFSTQYDLVAADGSIEARPGEVGLTTNPSTGFRNGDASYSDHTGNAGGLMLFVDGTYPNTNFWAETVAVQSHTTYTFTAWVASASAMNLGVIALFADGTPVTSPFTAPSTTGEWSKWSVAFNSGTASSITLALQDLNSDPFAAGNQFTVDDLSFDSPAPGGSEVPEPATVVLLASGTAVLLGFQRRRSARG